MPKPPKQLLDTDEDTDGKRGAAVVKPRAYCQCHKKKCPACLGCFRRCCTCNKSRQDTMNLDVSAVLMNQSKKCMTVGCVGLGNIDPRYMSHSSQAACPIAVRQASALQVAARITRCPTDGCDGSGNVNSRRYKFHTSVDSCPIAAAENKTMGCSCHRKKCNRCGFCVHKCCSCQSGQSRSRSELALLAKKRPPGSLQAAVAAAAARALAVPISHSTTKSQTLKRGTDIEYGGVCGSGADPAVVDLHPTKQQKNTVISTAMCAVSKSTVELKKALVPPPDEVETVIAVSAGITTAQTPVSDEEFNILQQTEASKSSKIFSGFTYLKGGIRGTVLKDTEFFFAGESVKVWEVTYDDGSSSHLLESEIKELL